MTNGSKTIRISDEYRNQVKTLSEQGAVGFLGLSVGKKEFQDKELIQAYAEYLHNTFNFSLMIVADTPKRHNIRAIEGVSEREASRRVLVAGDDFLRFIEKVTRPFYRVRPTRWLYLAKETPCKDDLMLLNQGYTESTSFRDDCNEHTRSFLKQPSNLAKIEQHSTLERSVAIAKDYLLEELALVFALPKIFRRNHCVEIYPGKMEIQYRISSGYYNTVPGENSPSLSQFSGRFSQGCTVYVEAYYDPPHS